MFDHSHHPADIALRINADPRQSYLSDFVYGAIDGAVTTFAVVSGVVGAGLPAEVIIILGIANLVVDGFSMAASNYLGTRTDQQLVDRAIESEKRHIAVEPEGEREEIRQIFAAKGFEGDALETVVDVITSNEKLWIDTMLTEEFGLQSSSRSPLRAAWVTFWSFIWIGFIPLMLFVWQWLRPDSAWSDNRTYLATCLMTGLTFFGVGAAKSRFVRQHWALAGLETLDVGGAAAALAYAIGAALGAAAIQG